MSIVQTEGKFFLKQDVFLGVWRVKNVNLLGKT